MRVRTDFPRPVREIESAFIAMRDGIRLAARIWLPADAESNPVPAVFELLPYRKNDVYAATDAMMHPYFAGHGYAAVRVDIRGSGDSEGVLEDEYLPSEHQDACEVIAWIARQPWCSGRVGMMGLSWSGFNALQVAALRPPALAAVITIGSTDDRYGLDIHYRGGCHLNEHFTWANFMFAFNSRPPDPAHVGERWRELWLQRLEGSGLWLAKWLRHQRRDDYWRHGSICENYGDIAVPVLAVSGFADGYTDTVLSLLENLAVPRRGLIGPWAHVIPHQREPHPGPNIGFLQEAVRWWDRWLKDVANGIEREPQLVAFLTDSFKPLPFVQDLPGRWVIESDWPSPNVATRSLWLSGSSLLEGQGEETTITHAPSFSSGLCSGTWEVENSAPELPENQQPDDGKALCFDTPALAGPLQLLGRPAVELEIDCDRPVGQIAARLCDVAPSGASTRISWGVLNLTHRDSHADPAPLQPGRRYRVTVHLKTVSHRLKEGHRLRLALSGDYWPTVWPAPEPFRLRLHPASSRLRLPVRRPQATDGCDPFQPAEGAAPLKRTVLRAADHGRTVHRDVGDRTITVTNNKDLGAYRLASNGLEYDHKGVERLRIVEDDPTSCRSEMEWTVRYGRDDWQVRTVTSAILTCTRTHFRIRATLDAYEASEHVFARSWDEHIERDLM